MVLVRFPDSDKSSPSETLPLAAHGLKHWSIPPNFYAYSHRGGVHKDSQLSQPVMASSLPSNVHISQHPCLRAKLSQLRSGKTNARESKTLVHEIALIVGIEALAKGLDCTASGTVSISYQCIRHYQREMYSWMFTTC